MNAQQEPYDLTNKKVTFMDHKENDKFVADDKVTIVDARNGSIQYTLHPQTYAGTGTAWFEINDMDGNKVDSTQSFTITVDEGMGVSVYNTNYVPALERLRDQMQNLIDQAQKIEDDQTNKFTQDLTNNLKNAQTQLNTKLTSMQQAYDNLENQRTSAFNTSQADRQNTFNQSEKSRSDTYTQDKTKRDADWTADKKRIDDEWTTDKARIDGEWQTKKATLDSTIADLGKKLSDIQTSLTDLSNTKLPAMNKYADDVQKKVTQLKADFNAIDFSSYAKVADVYTRQEVDQKVASAGKVKTVDGQQPDANGNIYSTNLVSNGYDIVANTATNAESTKSNGAWLTGIDALKPFADAINQLQGTGPNRVGTVDLNVLQGITKKVTTYICTSSDNKNTPPFFVDKRGILICFNY
ncbi:DUF2479 domain-containing protein, partial [Lactobacillus hominis]|nr:DUF2479 domain-containing protein [Lactobacillus hominis]